jgi:hypothetical protein
MEIQKLDIVYGENPAPPTCGAAFPKDEDYKTLLVRKDERKNEGGFNKEDVKLKKK